MKFLNGSKVFLNAVTRKFPDQDLKDGEMSLWPKFNQQSRVKLLQLFFSVWVMWWIGNLKIIATQVEIFKSFIWDTRKFSFLTSEALLRKTFKLFK